MIEMRLLLLLVVGISACAANDENRARPDDAETVAHTPDSPVGSPVDLILSEAGLGPAHICASLAEAAAALGPARDSVFVGESDDDRWPGKIVHLPDGHDVVLEASWVDSARIRRISTTSPRARTRGGVRVGTSLTNIPAASGPLEVTLPEGPLVLELKGDSVAAFVDSASEHEVSKRWTPEGDWLSIVPQSARIVELVSSGSCQHLDPAA